MSPEIQHYLPRLGDVEKEEVVPAFAQQLLHGTAI